MKKFIMIAAATLAALSFSTSAFAQTGSAHGGISGEEQQRMMSGGRATGKRQMMLDPDMHRRMMAMMERREEIMGKRGKRASAFGIERAWHISAEGKWVWRPGPNQAPGPRAALRRPVRVWMAACSCCILPMALGGLGAQHRC